MSEIEFLAKLLLEDSIDKEVKEKIVNRIVELEQSKPFTITLPTVPPTEVFIPSVFTPVCDHEYPNPWHGTIPPRCKKCGEPALAPYTITCSGSSYEYKHSV